jgi:hypothetical protein
VIPDFLMKATDDTHATTVTAASGRAILGLSGASLIPDAPSDGTIYGRLNGAWINSGLTGPIGPTGIQGISGESGGPGPTGSSATADWLSTAITGEVVLTGSGTVTISSWNLLSGSSEYIAALPSASGNTGKFIGIRTAASAFAVLLAPYSAETVYSPSQGASTYGFYFCGSNTAVLKSDGTSWRMVAEQRVVTLGATTTLAFTNAETSAAIN